MVEEPTVTDAAEGSGGRAEQSVQAFKDALEKSVTISRERLQEVVDDAVRRGRMTQSLSNYRRFVTGARVVD